MNGTRTIRRFPRWAVWLSAATAIFVLSGAGVAAAAIRFDANRSSELLKGVSVGGVKLDGMQFDAARKTLVARFERPLDGPISVEVAGKTFSVSPRALGANTDVLSGYRKAIEFHQSMPVLQRVWYRVTGKSLRRNFKVVTTIDEGKSEPFIDRIAAGVDRKPQNATVSLAGGGVKISPESPGYALDKQAAAKRLRKAAESGEQAVALDGKVLAPAVTKDAFKHVLVVKVGENKLFHYQGETLVKTYDVATGEAKFPTPKGQFKIISKRRNPTWVNPAKRPGGWGANLPERILPGPNNPLGTRAMDLNSRGIRIHGTSNAASIGYNASHGCIRMRMSDVEELFELVSVGTQVIITQSGPIRPFTRPSPSEPQPLAEADGTAIPGLPPGQPATPSASGRPEPQASAPAPVAPVPAGDIGEFPE